MLLPVPSPLRHLVISPLGAMPKKRTVSTSTVALEVTLMTNDLWRHCPMAHDEIGLWPITGSYDLRPFGVWSYGLWFYDIWSRL